MTHEAKFSVVLPASSLTAAQIETFEQTVNRYGLPVKLPLRADLNGNLIVSSSMCLRDAQMLRRQIANCGFPADVVSDASYQLEQKAPVSLDTLVVELDNISVDDALDPVSEITSDAWSSLEMPSSLDLGLSGADVFEDEKVDWQGENWLSPDDAGERTLSLSAGDLVKVAQSAAQDAALGLSSKNKSNAANPIHAAASPIHAAASPIHAAANPIHAPVKTQTPAVAPRQGGELQSSTQNPKVDRAANKNVGKSTSIMNVTPEQLKLLHAPSASDGAKNTVVREIADIIEKSEAGSDALVANPPAAAENSVKTDSKPEETDKPQSNAANTAENTEDSAKSEQKSETEAASDSASETKSQQSELQTAPSNAAEHKSVMKYVVFAASAIIAIFLILSLISAFLTPIPFLESIVKPLF